MKKVVIDSNVIYSGLYSSKGASFKILEAVMNSIIVPVVSISLFEEYSDILGRPPLSEQLTKEETEEFLDFICTVSEQKEVFFLWRPFLKDPKDDLVLEVAVASGVNEIVTHNIKDFVGIEQFGITALTPGDYFRKELIK